MLNQSDINNVENVI